MHASLSSSMRTWACAFGSLNRRSPAGLATSSTSNTPATVCCSSHSCAYRSAMPAASGNLPGRHRAGAGQRLVEAEANTKLDVGELHRPQAGHEEIPRELLDPRFVLARQLDRRHRSSTPSTPSFSVSTDARTTVSHPCHAHRVGHSSVTSKVNESCHMSRVLDRGSVIVGRRSHGSTREGGFVHPATTARRDHLVSARRDAAATTARCDTRGPPHFADSPAAPPRCGLPRVGASAGGSAEGPRSARIPC